MFRGFSQLNLDVKGRLAIPAKHRDALLERCGGHLTITADPSGCLLIYPLPDWELIEQKLEGLSNLDPRVRDLQRRVIGFATDVDMDGAGRVLIPPPLREYAELDKAVALVGQGRKFELWNKEAWDQRYAKRGELAPDGLPPELAGFSL